MAPPCKRQPPDRAFFVTGIASTPPVSLTRGGRRARLSSEFSSRHERCPRAPAARTPGARRPGQTTPKEPPSLRNGNRLIAALATLSLLTPLAGAPRVSAKSPAQGAPRR